ncbi:MAG: hypothetical protein J7K84_07665, partial [Deltaproteobacteria bacterium]|nr:hypothetical protein [Deltaproteobacteria bacterium]
LDSRVTSLHYFTPEMNIFLDIDRHINNFTALSVVGVLQYAFLPLALCQILKAGNYLTIYR